MVVYTQTSLFLEKNVKKLIFALTLILAVTLSLSACSSAPDTNTQQASAPIQVEVVSPESTWSDDDREYTAEDIARFTSTIVTDNHRTRECKTFLLPRDTQEVLIYDGIDPTERSVIDVYTGQPCITLLGTMEINDIEWGAVLKGDKIGFIKRHQISDKFGEYMERDDSQWQDEFDDASISY